MSLSNFSSLQRWAGSKVPSFGSSPFQAALGSLETGVQDSPAVGTSQPGSALVPSTFSQVWKQGLVETVLLSSFPATGLLEREAGKSGWCRQPRRIIGRRERDPLWASGLRIPVTTVSQFFMKRGGDQNRGSEPRQLGNRLI